MMASSVLTRVATGAAAGLAATVPMTAAIWMIFRRLPLSQKFSPPPHQVAMEMAECVGVKPHLRLDERVLLTLVSHFGYGAAMGALYGVGAEAVSIPPAVKGAGYGAAVWAGSYLGWLPAADFRAGADHQPRKRNAMMLAAHLVWGVALGLAFDRLARDRTSIRTDARRTSARRSLRAEPTEPLSAREMQIDDCRRTKS